MLQSDGLGTGGVADGNGTFGDSDRFGFQAGGFDVAGVVAELQFGAIGGLDGVELDADFGAPGDDESLFLLGVEFAVGDGTFGDHGFAADFDGGGDMEHEGQAGFGVDGNFGLEFEGDGRAVWNWDESGDGFLRLDGGWAGFVCGFGRADDRGWRLGDGGGFGGLGPGEEPGADGEAESGDAGESEDPGFAGRWGGWLDGRGDYGFEESRGCVEVTGLGLLAEAEEAVAEFGHGLETGVGILVEAAMDDVGENGRDFGSDFLDAAGLIAEDAGEHADAVGTGEGAHAGGHFVKDGAEGKDVGTGVGGDALGLFGGHIAEGADDGALDGERGEVGGVGIVA